MDISQRFSELRDGGAEVDEAVRQIFREDYNANIKQLQEVSGLDGAHVGRLKGQVSRAHARGVTPTRESIVEDKMASPMLIEFRQALDDLSVGKDSAFREHLCILFVNRIGEFQKDKDALEAFLYKHGLTPVQVNGVVERITVPQRGGLGQLGYQTIPLPGGGAIIIQTGQPQAQAGQPIVLGGSGQPGGESPEQVRQQVRLESRLDRLEEKLGALAGGGGGEPPMRRGRRPLFDNDGNILKDADGNIAYEDYEEPWEPGARDTLTETLLPLMVKQMVGGGQKPIDEETLVLKIKERLGGGEGQGKVATEVIREAVRSEMSGLSRDVESIKQDQARRERQEEIDRAVGRATVEHKEIIAGLTAQLGEKGGYKGLSDSQATMRYQKELVDTMVEAVGTQVASVREDIRPFILQQAVQNMKMQGLSDEVIGQFLNSVRQRLPGIEGVSESAKDEALKRVKQWSKT